MPRHDRAHGVYQQPGRASGKTSPNKGRGGGNRRGRFAPATDMSRQGGNTPKPNAPKPQQPKPNPKAPK